METDAIDELPILQPYPNDSNPIQRSPLVVHHTRGPCTVREYTPLRLIPVVSSESHLQACSYRLVPSEVSRRNKIMPPRTRNVHLKQAKDTEIGSARATKPAILVLGETGSGKSQFIKTADPHMSVSPEVSSSLKSCTQSVAAYTVYSLGNNSDTVTLVDTPGFNDSESGGDRAQLNRIIGWLKNNPDMHLIGVLYLHNIKNARVTLSPNVVGPREIVPLPPGVLVVTSHWGGSPSPKDISLEAEFQKQFCGQNAMVRFDGTRDSAWAAIRQLQSAGVSIPLKNFETRLQKMHDLLPDDKMQARRFARMTYPGWIAKMFH